MTHYYSRYVQWWLHLPDVFWLVFLAVLLVPCAVVYWQSRREEQRRHE